MGKSQRDKGKRGERECAQHLRDAFGPAYDVRRGWQPRGAAVVCEPDVMVTHRESGDRLPYWFEVKTGAAPRMRAALEQATADAPAGVVPVAWIRFDKLTRPVAVLWGDDLAELLAALEVETR